MFRKILVLNRGEIACRILRTCRRLGVATVAVYSDADAALPHVKQADSAVRLGPAPVKDSYLNLDAIVEAIRSSGAEAVHPGYGLLSESPRLARAVADTGAVFIGPKPEILERLGDKISARALARSVGVEPPPGSASPLDPSDAEAVAAEAERVGYPVIVKAAAGGGGIGMLVVREASELARAVKTCTDRARQAFSDDRVYLERYLERPRHIEVQILVDRAGNGVALGERECSVQRRHQKVLEESPSPASFFTGEAGEQRRQALFAKALRVVHAANYEGAGTVEFVCDASGSAYFLEVNARLQVEHPVTEMVTGLDLVEQQLCIACGEELRHDVQAVARNGHAVEVRIYAEDPSKNFLPQPGRIETFAFPMTFEGVRIESGFEAGAEVTPYYDPLLAKLIAHGATREIALERLDAALEATQIALVGPKGPRATNLAWLRQVLAEPMLRTGDYDTGLADRVGARS
ncbi:MAG TPA: biotin carboxylase N-terminal domain-containing protein [Polyangiaceae bacterium]|nr:biotin carboxylase N-terminal domain-containing protein [Polyangiaceae bacterium]